WTTRAAWTPSSSRPATSSCRPPPSASSGRSAPNWPNKPPPERQRQIDSERGRRKRRPFSFAPARHRAYPFPQRKSCGGSDMKTRSMLGGLATACSILALATAAAAQTADSARDSTEFTRRTDAERAPEQLAMRFDKADLTIKVIPDDKAIDAVAVLDFTATAPLDALVVELDTLFTIGAISVDGVDVPADRWSNPEGRLTVRLTEPLAAGQSTRLRIAYTGQPHVA